MTYFYDGANKLLYTALVPLCFLNAGLWKWYTQAPVMAFTWLLLGFLCIAFLRRNYR